MFNKLSLQKETRKTRTKASPQGSQLNMQISSVRFFQSRRGGNQASWANFRDALQIRKSYNILNEKQAGMEYLTSDLVCMRFHFLPYLRISKLYPKLIQQRSTAETMSNFFANLKQVRICNFLRLPDRLISMLGPLFGWLFIRSGPLSHGDMRHLHTRHKAIWK